MNHTKSGWKGVPWFWVSFPGTYNMAHFKKAGFEGPPRTWDELLKQGKALKKQGNPVGIAISHCSDAHSTYWSVAWSFGAKVFEPEIQSAVPEFMRHDPWGALYYGDGHLGRYLDYGLVAVDPAEPRPADG